MLVVVLQVVFLAMFVQRTFLVKATMWHAYFANHEQFLIKYSRHTLTVKVIVSVNCQNSVNVI